MATTTKHSRSKNPHRNRISKPSVIFCWHSSCYFTILSGTKIRKYSIIARQKYEQNKRKTVNFFGFSFSCLFVSFTHSLYSILFSIYFFFNWRLLTISEEGKFGFQKMISNKDLESFSVAPIFRFVVFIFQPFFRSSLAHQIQFVFEFGDCFVCFCVFVVVVVIGVHKMRWSSIVYVERVRFAAHFEFKTRFSENLSRLPYNTFVCILRIYFRRCGKKFCQRTHKIRERKKRKE